MLSTFRQILTIVRHHRFFCKDSKCRLGWSRMGFSDHVLEGGSILMNPSKQAAVCDWPTPHNTPDVRSFMGLVNYNPRSIPRLAHIALPLLSLTHKDTPWSRRPEHQEAFDELWRRYLLKDNKFLPRCDNAAYRTHRDIFRARLPSAICTFCF